MAYGFYCVAYGKLGKEVIMAMVSTGHKKTFICLQHFKVNCPTLGYNHFAIFIQSCLCTNSNACEHVHDNEVLRKNVIQVSYIVIS